MVIKCDKCKEELDNDSEAPMYQEFDFVGYKFQLCINCVNDVYKFVTGKLPPGCEGDFS